ncbi:MAG: VWA domain-containing protein [Acidobacteria bacterium]|nr:VWA domain-containing protein [Acidobacteriota bacterium]
MLRFQPLPEALWVALLLGALVLLRRTVFRKDAQSLHFPATAEIRRLSGPGRLIPIVGRALRWAALAVLAVGLCNPVVRETVEVEGTRGVDIVLTLDVSTSMSARDFQPSRLEAARVVLRDFIRRRPHDRMSLVTFAGEAWVQCPLTSDHYSLQSLLESVSLTPFETDGTAVGMALAYSVNRLRESRAGNRIVVLLTDGVNNRGEISPLQAAEFCRTYRIRVYTVTIGSRGETEVMARAPDGSPTWIRSSVDFDAETAEKIARSTGGRAFLASDPRALEGIYAEIDRLEKTQLERKVVWRDREMLPVFAVVSLILTALALVPTLFHPDAM